LTNFFLHGKIGYGVRYKDIEFIFELFSERIHGYCLKLMIFYIKNIRRKANEKVPKKF